MKTVEISGITFEVVNIGTKQANMIFDICGHGWCKQWYDLYTRPSQEKQDIKDYWERSILELDGEIRGYTGNTFTFAIYGTIPYKGHDCYFQITPNHNRICL